MAMHPGGELTMYPNPNRGDELFISLTQVAAGVNTASVDIYDMTLIVHRDLRTDMIASNPENLQWQVSWRAALKVERRNHHGKLTGVTA